ncbi:MAG: TolC family protein [Rikenellaceae bacterium]|nr:TolC family protein [Rikenellaceae bacterium]
MKLKNLFFTLLAMVSVATVSATTQENGAATTASEPLVLTLEQALQIALSESPTVKIADKTIEAKKYAKKGTYSSLWPDISASGTYQRYIKKQTFHIMGQTMEVGTTNNMSAGVNAAMPLVNAQLWKSLKLSAMDVELAVEQARSSRVDMVEQVSKAFYQVLLAKDSYNVYKRVYDNAVENHKIVEKRYSVGAVSEYDFIRSKVSVSNAEPNVFNAENSIIVALWQLKALLGLDMNKEIDCAGSLADFEPVMTSHIAHEMDLSNNSTMRQLDIQERMLDKSIELKRSANLPSLALSIGYNFVAMDETMKLFHYRWNPYSVAALSLNIPIFSGFKRRSDVKQAKIDLENLQLQRENVERQLYTAMKQYESSMLTNLKQYHASSENISQAKRGYDIAVKRYEVGGGTLVDVDNSQLAYTQAELSRSTAIYNYLVNQVSLEKIKGTTENSNSQEN